jgi:hypothetical protein
LAGEFARRFVHREKQSNIRLNELAQLGGSPFSMSAFGRSGQKTPTQNGRGIENRSKCLKKLRRARTRTLACQLR